MTPPTGRPRVVVVGGGVTGLATAWFLREEADVTVVEASDRLGGKIGSLDLAGIPVEAGPDTFLARVPHAADLCRAVGLGEDLVAPATAAAFIWMRGRLRPLPTGMLGVPTTPIPLVRSGILTPGGLVRAAADLVMPRDSWGDDPSVAEVVGGRLGTQVVDRLVEPLVGGINAGCAEGLSLAATAPQLATVASGHRSLILGARRERRRRPPPAGPVFLGLLGGMERMIDRLAEQVEKGGVSVRTGVHVENVEIDTEAASRRHVVRVSSRADDQLPADFVVLTVPAYAAAPIVRRACPNAADDLEAIAYASVALVTFAYRRSAFATLPTGAGFLVPRTEGRLMTACTFTSSKWPGTGSDEDLFVLRASAGRHGDERIAALDDAELTTRLHLELAAALGIRARPEASVVARWPRSFPQYPPGHRARVDRLESTLEATIPGVVLAGAAYHGLGIASCVRQAEAAATRILASQPPANSP